MDESLRKALEHWFKENPWERLAPGDGLAQTDEPWGCVTCGATVRYEEPDLSPGWAERPFGPQADDGEHEPLCLWLAARTALRSDAVEDQSRG